MTPEEIIGRCGLWSVYKKSRNGFVRKKYLE